jgi:hypothetical protein
MTYTFDGRANDWHGCTIESFSAAGVEHRSFVFGDEVRLALAHVGVGVRLSAWLANDLIRRSPCRGRTGSVWVLDVRERVIILACQGDVWVAYWLAFPSWYGLLPGHQHVVARVTVCTGSVVLCVTCGKLWRAA